MARKTKAQLAEEAALAAAEVEEDEELDSLMEAGYEAGEAEDDPDEEFSNEELRNAVATAGWEAFKDEVIIRCTKVENTKGKDSGDQYIKLTWVVQEGPHAKANIWDIIMLAGKGIGFGKGKLEALGLDPNSFKRSDFAGLTVHATTKIEVGKGNYEDKTAIRKYGARVGDIAAEDVPE